MQMKGYDHIYVVSFFNIRVQKWKKRISVVKSLYLFLDILKTGYRNAAK